MSSRYLRPTSPPSSGRRSENPARASTGTVYKSHDVPSSYTTTTRETYTSPRSSGERVAVPISKETYVDGRLVESTRKPSAVDPDYYGKHHHRRSTFDADPRASAPAISSLRPSTTVQHHERDISPSDYSAIHDDRYVSSSSNPRRGQKKVYSIDEGRATRIPTEQDSRSRDDRAEVRSRQPPADRDHDYHLRGAPKVSNIDDYGAYEYTDARGMFRDTEPKWRPRRGSIDTVTRERPSSMVETSQSTPRPYNRELGPPPTTRGFEKVNNTNVSRHGSLQGTYRRSPSRSRGYTTSSTYSDDENYRVPPRISKPRDDASYYSERDSGFTSPTRAPPDDYYEPRGSRSTFKDRDVASRGFGIRAPSVDARSSRESDVDRYPPQPLMIEAPPPATPTRRDYPPEPKEASRDDRYRDNDWREPERIRDGDRDAFRTVRESQPQWERDIHRDRDYVGREKDKDFESSKRERDRDYRDREYDKYPDEDYHPRNQRSERDYTDDRREKGDKDRRSDRVEADFHPQQTHQDHSLIGGAIAGAAAAGAAAPAVKDVYDRRHQGGRQDDRESDREGRAPVEPRDTRETSFKYRDDYPEDRRRDDRDNERTNRENERSRRLHDDEDEERPRPRHYVPKKQEAEVVQRRDGDVSPKQSQILNPEEDYRRRVQQQQQEIGRSQGRREDKDDDSDRERRRHDRQRPRDIDSDRELRGGSDGYTESTSASQTPSRGEFNEHAITDSPVSEETSEPSESKPPKKRVSILVDPPKEQRMPKSILRKPTDKFPEDPNAIREGVAPLNKAKTSGDGSIPPNARWTKITRSMVNPEALIEHGERYEERQDHVIVLRVLTKEEIQKFANRTKEIRDARYAERKDKERKDHHSSSDDKDRDSHREREHEHDRRERERGKPQEQDRDQRDQRDRDQEGPKGSADRYKPESYA